MEHKVVILLRVQVPAKEMLSMARFLLYHGELFQETETVFRLRTRPSNELILHAHPGIEVLGVYHPRDLMGVEVVID